MLHLSNIDNKGFSTRKDGILYVLGNRHTPPANSLVVSGEFMIVTRLGKHPRGWLIEPVDEDHELVSHEGFITTGATCCTTAWAPALRKAITPGRLNGIIYTATDASLTLPGNIVPPKIPGLCYVKRGESRLAGIPDLGELHRSEVFVS